MKNQTNKKEKYCTHCGKPESERFKMYGCTGPCNFQFKLKLNEITPPIIKEEKDIVVCKSWWGRKVGIINKVLGNDFYLVDEFYWYGDDNKVKYCEVIKGNRIIS